MSSDNSITFRAQDTRYHLDIGKGQLSKGRERIHLPPKEWHLLVYLAQHPDELVSKGELLDVAWNLDEDVSEWVVNKTISNIRGALGDRAKDPLFIETVHGRGYRFVAKLEEELPSQERRRSELSAHREFEAQPSVKYSGEHIDDDVPFENGLGEESSQAYTLEGEATPLVEDLRPEHSQWFGRHFLDDEDSVNDVLVEDGTPVTLTVARRGSIDCYRLTIPETQIYSIPYSGPIHEIKRLSPSILAVGNPWGVSFVNCDSREAIWHYNYKSESSDHDDGAVLATCSAQGEGLVCVGSWRNVRCLDQAGHLRWRKRTNADRVWSLSVSSDSRFLCVGTHSGMLEKIEVQSGKRYARVRLAGSIRWNGWIPNDQGCIAITSSKLHIVSADYASVRSFDLTSHLHLKALGGHEFRLANDCGVFPEAYLVTADFLGHGNIAVVGIVEGYGTFVLNIDSQGHIVSSVPIPRRVRWMSSDHTRNGVLCVDEEGAVDRISLRSQ